MKKGPFAENTTLSGIKFLEILGQGSFGTVYRAIKQEQEVAIKVMGNIKDEREEYEDEMWAYSALKHPHPNVMTILDVVFIVWRPCVIFPLMDRNLHDEIHVHDITPQLCMKFSRDIMLGIQHIHQNNVIHRDIKSENIMINGDNAVIADLGNACMIGSNDLDIRTTSWYMAPETLLKCYKPACPLDIWAVGCTIYEMVTKKPLMQVSFDEKEYIELLKSRTGQIYPCHMIKSCAFDMTPYINTSTGEPLVNVKDRHYTYDQPSTTWGADIFRILRGLLNVDPSKRISLHLAINELEQINTSDDVMGVFKPGATTNDRSEYTRNDFFEELRIDPIDNKAYTKSEFIEFYGGSNEWNDIGRTSVHNPDSVQDITNEDDGFRDNDENASDDRVNIDNIDINSDSIDINDDKSDNIDNIDANIDITEKIGSDLVCVESFSDNYNSVSDISNVQNHHENIDDVIDTDIQIDINHNDLYVDNDSFADDEKSIECYNIDAKNKHFGRFRERLCLKITGPWRHTWQTRFGDINGFTSNDSTPRPCCRDTMQIPEHSQYSTLLKGGIRRCRRRHGTYAPLLVRYWKRCVMKRKREA